MYTTLQNLLPMGKSKKSIDKVIEKDIQILKEGEMSRLLGGKLNGKSGNKWNNTGLNTIMPQ